MADKSEELVTFIRGWLAEQLGQAEVAAEVECATLGLDSRDAVELTDALAQHLGAEELPVSLILDFPSAKALAQELSRGDSEVV